MPEDGSKAQFQRHNPLPPLLAFSLCGCVWWQSLSRFQPFTFYFDSIWKKHGWRRMSTCCFEAVLIPSVTAHQRSNSPRLSIPSWIYLKPSSGVFQLISVPSWIISLKKKKKKKNCSRKHTGSSERPEIILSASTGRIRRVLIILKTKLLLFTTWWQCNCGHLHFLTWLKQMSSAVKKKKKEKKEKKERKCWQRQSGESDLLEKYLKRDTQTVVRTVQMR